MARFLTFSHCSDQGDGTEVIHVPFLAGGAIGTKFDWNFTTTPQVRLSLSLISDSGSASKSHKC
jgi:hypothetical protein